MSEQLSLWLVGQKLQYPLWVELLICIKFYRMPLSLLSILLYSSNVSSRVLSLWLYALSCCVVSIKIYIVATVLKTVWIKGCLHFLVIWLNQELNGGNANFSVTISFRHHLEWLILQAFTEKFYKEGCQHIYILTRKHLKLELKTPKNIAETFAIFALCYCVNKNSL